MSLTPDQARALWDAGGFAVLTGLPQGSEVGLDGVHHAVAAFSGYKFVPPGFHLLLWSLDAATGLPLRSALLKTWAPKERYALALSDEEVIARTDVEEAELRALDPQLAPYPFASLETWKSLSAPISTAVLEEVLESVGGRVDSMTPVEGEKDELEAVMVRKRPRGKEDVGRREGEKKDEEKGDGADQREDALPKSPAVSEGQVVKHTPNTDSIRLPLFDLRRSWPDGAKGDDVTRWSQDKSKLWERVASEHGGPTGLLGHLALSFLLVSQVWNYPSLAAYKRLLSLYCRSLSAVAEPELHGHSSSAQAARENTLALVNLLAAQISSLPATAFEAELPDLDVFYLDEIEALRRALGSALAVRGWWGMAGRAQTAWARLQATGRKRGWMIGDLAQGDEEESEGEEEGEYAPVVVET